MRTARLPVCQFRLMSCCIGHIGSGILRPETADFRRLLSWLPHSRAETFQFTELSETFQFPDTC